jgi:predicted SAM-dependent methyltransferase
LIKLDVGCGYRKSNGFIGIDLKNADINLNIEKQKLPFKNNSVDFIKCFSTLEHINNIDFVMKEFYRVLKNNGKLIIIVPYWNSGNAFRVYHRTFFNATWYKVYTSNTSNQEQENNINFKLGYNEFIYSKWGKFLPFRNKLKSVLTGTCEKIKTCFIK